MKNNKFKIIAFLLAIICVAIVAYDCGRNSTESEIADSAPIATITASAADVSEVNFEFEAIYLPHGGRHHVYREITTDTLWVHKNPAGGISQMFDPETGKPLTYTLWKEKYAK